MFKKKKTDNLLIERVFENEIFLKLNLLFQKSGCLQC